MVVLPVKPFAEAKSRLAPALGARERAVLARQLLERTLRVIDRARGIARVVVISRDAAVLQLARSYGAWSIVEPEPGAAPDKWGAVPRPPTDATAEAGVGFDDLNRALARAARVCAANGARALLVLPADLPRLRARDVHNLIALAEPAPRLVLAPAHRDGGTNALLLNPITPFPFQFGPDSLQRHQSTAQAMHLAVTLYSQPTITHDLDLPEDLALSAFSRKGELR